IKAQKRQIRKDRDLLEDANRPFEERNEQYVGFNSVTGGIDLMVGKKGNPPAKVITLPNDRTYSSNKEVRMNDQPDYESEYLKKQAESALKKLRAIGE
ncbi:MAG: hypothetical protein PHQ65_15215, partial [Bacteroidales bacterium]|nr:hypothetical protein [Bacteroidales bacterium]